MINNGLIISYVLSNHPVIELHDDNSTITKIQNISNMSRLLTTTYGRALVGPAERFAYLKSYKNGETILFNYISGSGDIPDYMFGGSVSKSNPTPKTHDSDIAKEFIINANTQPSYLTYISYLKESANVDQMYFNVVPNYNALYDIGNGVINVGSIYKDNVKKIAITISGLITEKIRRLRYRTDMMTIINGYNVTDPSVISYDYNDSTKLIQYILLTEDVLKRINYTGGSITLTSLLRLINPSNNSVYDSNIYSSTYTPPIATEALKCIFASTDYGTPISGTQYMWNNAFNIIVPAHDSEAFKGAIQVISDDPSNTQTFNVYTSEYDTPSGFTKLITETFHPILGIDYKIKTNVRSVFSNETYYSDPLAFYHQDQYINILNVSLTASGTKQAAGVYGFDYYTAGGELSSNVNLNYRFGSVGQIMLYVKFEMVKNTTILDIISSHADIKIQNQLLPKVIYLIAATDVSPFWGATSELVKTQVSSSIRTKDEITKFPNISSSVGSEMIKLLPTTPMTFESGVIYKKYDTAYSNTYFPTTVFTETMTLPIDNNGNYSVILILQSGSEYYGYTYSCYDLTKLDNNSDTLTQFDF